MMCVAQRVPCVSISRTTHEIGFIEFSSHSAVPYTNNSQHPIIHPIDERERERRASPQLLRPSVFVFANNIPIVASVDVVIFWAKMFASQLIGVLILRMTIAVQPPIMPNRSTIPDEELSKFGMNDEQRLLRYFLREYDISVR